MCRFAPLVVPRPEPNGGHTDATAGLRAAGWAPPTAGGARHRVRGDAGALGELLARAILDNLYRFVVPAIAGPARLVPLAALANREMTADALRTAAARGRLQATRGPDGQWRSSSNWVQAYLASRYRRDRG